jgi:hypothetical protein
MNLYENDTEVDLMDWWRKTQRFGFVLLSVVAMLGCSTTSPAPSLNRRSNTLPPPAFIPANFVAGIEHDKGNLQSIFSLPSHSVWVDRTILEVKQAYE